MHKRFDHAAFEKKWQATWQEAGLYEVKERDESKPKEYVLVELPYPSGNLHIGHWYAFAVPDIYVRYRRMTGTDVIYPMGFDAFGLPAENAAIKRDLDPKEWTEGNIEFMKGQLASMGNAFTWNMTTSTIEPSYYRWTQWMFTQFFEKGIAYRGTGTVNWCPSCNTVIANEQVLADDTCERCGTTIEKRQMPQWMMRITDYADRLVDDLADLNWPEHIKDSQRNWIGRSQGAELEFALSVGDSVKVFTTRPDTLFGATYLVLAPEHALIEKHKSSIQNWDNVAAYIKQAAGKKEMDRLDATKEKTGILLEGITATNPATKEEIPVYIADYVLAGYGTGAIMAVPAHDERDYEFAKKYDIDIKQVVEPVTNLTVDASAILLVTDDGKFLLQKRSANAPENPNGVSLFGGGLESDETPLECALRELVEELELKPKNIYFHQYKDSKLKPGTTKGIFIVDNVDKESLVLNEGAFILEVSSLDELKNAGARPYVLEVVEDYLKNPLNISAGALLNSNEFNGMDSEQAKVAITKHVGGKLTNTYRLRDWSIGRQRYWGVPIPIVYDPEGKAHPVPEEHLPWTLPTDVDFRPTGEPPLAKSKELKERTERIFGPGWTPEVETMDTFVDSSWYFLRYLDPHNEKSLCSLDVQKDWMPVDIYFGGAEHTTMHLLYSRFWQKALFDLGLAAHAEPYQRRINRGLILGPDGNKMSKSKGNVIDPDEQVERVGSDTVKMYLAFMGPYGEASNYPWDMGGIAGIRRFLERVYGLSEHLADNEDASTTRALHQTIKKVGEDIVALKFNTAISALMVFVNHAEKAGLGKESYETFLKLLAPFAPHLAEELWHGAGHSSSVHSEAFPEYNAALTVAASVTIGVQVNGKVRGDITLTPEASEAEALAAAKDVPAIAGRLSEREIATVIYKPGRILNIIVPE